MMDKPYLKWLFDKGIQSELDYLSGDGKVNTADAVLILKYAAGMITTF